MLSLRSRLASSLPPLRSLQLQPQPLISRNSSHAPPVMLSPSRLLHSLSRSPPLVRSTLVSSSLTRSSFLSASSPLSLRSITSGGRGPRSTAGQDSASARFDPHHRTAALDAAGLSCRNPHYQLYLELPPIGLERDPSIRRVLLLLVGVNVAVFLAWMQATVDEETKRDRTRARWMSQHFLSNEQNVREGRWWTLVTSGFSHRSLPHLAFNMIALWTLGPAAMLACGSTAAFLTLYVGAAASCSLAHIAYSNIIVPKVLDRAPQVVYDPTRDRHRMSYDVSALGASGSVMAVALVSAFAHPRQKFYIMFIPIGIQARILFPILIAGDLALSFSNKQTGIGHWGHLGGALFGLVCWMGALRMRRMPASLTHVAPTARTFWSMEFEAMRRRQAMQAMLMGNKPSSPIGSPTTSTSPSASGSGVRSAFTPRSTPAAPPRRNFSTLQRSQPRAPALMHSTPAIAKRWNTRTH